MMDENIRLAMTRKMDIRGLKLKTKVSYLRDLAEYLNHFNCKDPEQLGVEQLKDYQQHLLIKEGLAPRTVNRHICSIRFYYTRILKQWWMAEEIVRVKAPKTIPTVLSEEEVALMITKTESLFYKSVLMVLYSTGMRQAELRALKTFDIDRDRKVINVRDGKGGKDRQVFLSPLVLETLSRYWKAYRLRLIRVESDWLFIPTKNSFNGVLAKPLSHTAIDYMIKVATKAAGIKKKSLHTLLDTRLQFTY